MAPKIELPAASLNPQTYTEASLPADFDLRLGHPLLAAMSAPLAQGVLTSVPSAPMARPMISRAKAPPNT